MAGETQPSWADLKRAADAIRGRTLTSLFADDPGRAERLTFRAGDCIVDMSKNRMDAAALEALLRFARERGFRGARNALFAGENINSTEQRPALHMALRAPDVPSEGEWTPAADILRDVVAERNKFLEFSDAVRDGTYFAHDGEKFTDVLNLGIGGSDLGPRMVTEALAAFHDGPAIHTLANVDGGAVADLLKRLDPARTLCIISSKSFTTVETMTNARTVRAWLEQGVGASGAATHMAAVTTATDAAGAFGIPADRQFGFWDWVGGRFSLWSAIGLSVAIAIGSENFRALLDGAHEIDAHFNSAADEQNVPLLLALLDVWYRNGFGYANRVVAPYDERLRSLPLYLQQLEMESNGKRVGKDGAPLNYSTTAVVFGGAGTNGQHAFFQMLHQGTDIIPVEFLVAAEGHEPDLAQHHDILVANCLAQGEAFLRGRLIEEARGALIASGTSHTEADRLAPHAVFPGNRPSTTILYPKLTPRVLGQLLAIYEHRTFAAGVLWGINSFDQFGVELGKTIAGGLVDYLRAERPGGDIADAYSSSTGALIGHIKALRSRHGGA